MEGRQGGRCPLRNMGCHAKVAKVMMKVRKVKVWAADGGSPAIRCHEVTSTREKILAGALGSTQGE